jgi:Ca2+-transporting ATPase
MKYKNLSSIEVIEIQEKYGKNILPEEKIASGFKIFISQFANPLVYVLLLAGIISIFLQKYFDIVLIFSVVVVNAMMGFFQEYKTQKTLSALKKLVRPTAKVLRDNERQKILASNLVPGDIVFLGAGDRIPADGRIVEAASFFINEAILTGESEPVLKKQDEDVFMGTIVVSGRAIFEVTKIGLYTKIGDIAKTLKETVQPPTTLQLRLKKLTHTLIFISLFLSFLVFIFGFYMGRNFWQMAELSAVLLVAIIPEALLIVITLILVLAMRDSLKRKALIRKILAIETLGSVTTICIDKTGTITEGIMRITETNFKNNKNGLLGMCLCNDLNDTVEVAIWEYLRGLKDFNVQEVYDTHSRVFEISFGPEHKFMATVNTFQEKDGLHYSLFVKGAPEILALMCNMPESEKALLQNQINEWSEKGLKVLGLASKKISKDEINGISANNISGLEWDGLLGLWDPPRKEAKETFSIAKKSGLKIKIVTGDYYKTAVKVMEYLGIDVAPEQIMEGSQLENLTDSQLDAVVDGILLFTRVTPQQKLRIVNILQKKGEIVAMTGDGVNDAPALKKSNIGIVMGDASEVAKETADIILLDSNFKTIVFAVEAGRLVFENIKKIILFILSNSFAEVVVIMGALYMNWPFPISAVQILWLHILCDGPEDFILGFEPREKETMLEGPKKIEEPILDKMGLFLIFTISLLSGILSLGFFWYFGLYQGNLKMGQTMAFMSLAFSSVIYIFSCRTLRKPFWRYENFWSNKWLFAVVAFSLSLAVIITYFPPTQNLLNLTPLGIYHWIILALKGIFLVTVIEVAKYIKNYKYGKLR